MGFSNVYAGSLVMKMLELQRMNLFCDATIVLDRCQLRAHSVVLSAASPKLKTMIECLQASSKPLMLEMAGCSAEVAEMMLEYLYTGNAVEWNERGREWRDLVKLFLLLEVPLPENCVSGMDQPFPSSTLEVSSCHEIIDAENASDISSLNKSDVSSNLPTDQSHASVIEIIPTDQNHSDVPCFGDSIVLTEDVVADHRNVFPLIPDATLLKKAESSLLASEMFSKVKRKKIIIEKRPTLNLFRAEDGSEAGRDAKVTGSNGAMKEVKVIYSPPLSLKVSGLSSPDRLNLSSSSVLPHLNLESSLQDMEGSIVQFVEDSVDEVDFDCSAFRMESDCVDEFGLRDVDESCGGGDVRFEKSWGSLCRSESDESSPGEAKNLNSYECIDCRRVFRKYAALLTHMRCHRKKIPHECSECHQRFGYPVFLSRHAFEKHGNYVCPKCGANCTCSPRRAHQLRNQVMNSEKLICQECGKACSSKETMRKHLLIHTTTRSAHVCEVCGKSFRIKCQLSSHLALHNQQPHKCSTCNATFSSQWKLDMHAETHREVRPIECTVCHARFFSRQTLRIHSYRHEGTEFKCPHCSKVLSTPFNLRNHMKIHLRETHKNFKCSTCGKFYYDYKDLSRHKKSHNEFRPHSCLRCDRAFKTKAHLKYHVNSHDNEGPVECERCGATFKKKYSYQQHLSRSKCRGVWRARGKKEGGRMDKLRRALDGQAGTRLVEVNACNIEEHCVQDAIL